MRPNGVYLVTASQLFSIGDTHVFELQLPTNLTIEIVRAWVGPDLTASPTLAMRKISWYTAATAGSGLSPVAEIAVQGGGDAAASMTGVMVEDVRNVGAVDIWNGAYHTAIGWTYFPSPEERIRVNGTDTPNFGLGFPDGDATEVLSLSVKWQEFL